MHTARMPTRAPRAWADLDATSAMASAATCHQCHRAYIAQPQPYMPPYSCNRRHGGLLDFHLFTHRERPRRDALHPSQLHPCFSSLSGPHTERFKPSLCYVSGSSSVCSQATCRTPPCSYHDIRTATCCCDACSAAHASTPRLTTSLVGRRHTILTVPAHTISASTGDLPVKLAHGFLAPGADSMRLVHWHFSPSVLPPCETTVCRLVLAGTASFRTTHFIAHTVLQRDRSATAATRAGMQPPLWDPYPRGGLRASIASTSSCVSPKASSHRHLYVELPDSTLALAVKDPPSLGSSRNMLPQPYPGVPPPPFLLEANTLDGPPGSAGSSFPHTIHFTSYMPILLHPTLSGVQIPGTINASLQPISPLYAHPAGLHLSGSGRLQPPSDAQEPPGSTASSRPLSDTTAERPIDPDLLRRRQSLRQPYQAQEMLYSCNSDSTAETLFVRMQPPLSAAEMTAIGLPSSEGLAGMQRDSRAAIGLPSIAPPVDAAAGGALVAALSQRNVNGPAIGLPVSELRCCHSAPSSARCAVADTDDGRGGVPEEQKPASAEPGVGPEAGVAGAYIAAASAPVTAAESGRQVGAAAQHDAAQPASAAGAAASTDAPGSPQGGEAEA